MKSKEMLQKSSFWSLTVRVLVLFSSQQDVLARGIHVLLGLCRRLPRYSRAHKHAAFTGTTSHLKTERKLPRAPRLRASAASRDQRAQCGCREVDGEDGMEGAGRWVWAWIKHTIRAFLFFESRPADASVNIFSRDWSSNTEWSD